MRAVWLTLLLGCGRIGFDATGGGNGDDTPSDADPPIPDAVTLAAPCDVPTLVAMGDVASSLNAAAAGTSYRVTWMGGGVTHILGIERTGEQLAVRERMYGASAFLPTPIGADIEIVNGQTVHIMWGTTQTEVRLLNVQLATARSTAYGALITDLARAGETRMFLVQPGNDLRLGLLTPSPTALEYTPSVTVEMQMTAAQRVAPTPNGGIVVAARPNGDDCDVWTYTDELTRIGGSAVPSDPNACDEIDGAYATAPARRAITYSYTSGALTQIRVQGIDVVATPDTPMFVANGIRPRIATGGNLFRLGYVATSGLTRVATVGGALAILGDAELHPSPIRSFALASGDGEVIAVYATQANEVFLRRFCGS